MNIRLYCSPADAEQAIENLCNVFSVPGISKQYPQGDGNVLIFIECYLFKEEQLWFKEGRNL